MEKRNRVIQLLIRHYYADTTRYLLSVYRRSQIGMDGDWAHEIREDVHDAYMEMENKRQAILIGDELVIRRKDGTVGGIGVVLRFAKNKARNHIKKITRRLINDREFREAIGFQEIIDTRTEDENEFSEFWKYIQGELKEDHLLALSLFYFESLSVREVANRIGRTETAICSLLLRLRKQLKVLHCQFNNHNYTTSSQYEVPRNEE